MKSALEMSVPQRMPQVSRLRNVFGCARLVKVVRKSGGSMTVRRGAPDSVKAVGLKVYLDAGVASCVGGGEGEAIGDGRADKSAEGLGGRGGAKPSGASLAGIGGGGRARS